ncbi:MAG: peptidase [Gemmatimonadota bacterium]
MATGGHDNNRDSYMNALAETENMSRIQFREWFPQIVYNHHQSGPAGSVLFAPPFRDPFNYNFDPLIPAQIDAVGAAMHSRFIAENKPGAVTRRATSYSTWWNGGVRTTVYFHNMIGLLTETVGSPTPSEIPFVPRYQLPTSDVFMPIEPQKVWHFRQSIDYSVTANYAVLDYASRQRETLLYNIYRMGRNSIERGSRDHWTRGAWDVERARAAYTADSLQALANRATDSTRTGTSRRPRYETTVKYFNMVRDSAKPDARAYILPAHQPDFATATKFVNALIKSGITVHRARSAFAVGGKSYPAGSYVVKTAQAFRPHVLDMFEPQQHPNDFQYPGGPPIAPYDNAGYTLAYQMGVQFDRVLDGFDGPLDAIQGLATVPAGRITGNARSGGYTFSHAMNDAFTAVNRLLAAGHDVYWLRDAAGTFFVRSRPGLDAVLRSIAQEKGVSFTAARAPAGNALKLRPVRIALWDQYGGSMPSGWIRYVLEQFEFPFDVVYPVTLDAGNLRAQYDVIILPNGSLPSRRGDGDDSEDSSTGDLEHVPDEWRARMGRITQDKTAPQLAAFLEQGGAVVTIGSGTRLAEWLGVPVEDALTREARGQRRALPREEFYVPGSVLEAKVDNSHPLAAGMRDRVAVLFATSPSFRLGADAAARGVRGVAWYEGSPLRSGWAWGQPHLENTFAAVEAPVGAGKLFLFGPEITFRAQPHGTFKFLFNAVYSSTAAPATVR